jgi:DNA-damage-inducible protein D
MMPDSGTEQGSPFEAIRHTTDEGAEYWSARELMTALEYALWQNFHTAIKRAMTACETSGQQVSDHFIAVNKMIEAGKGAKRQVQDYSLSRYACYLIAMNGDPGKPVIAAAQTYFAVQTRRTELADAQIEARRKYQRLGYSEEWIDRRLQGITVRDELTAEWTMRGAKEGQEFAALTDTLQRGTFDLSTREHKQVKHISAKQNLRDSMTGLELALTTLTEETAKAMHQTRDSQGYGELARDAGEAGEVGGAARRDIEERIGAPVVSSENYKTLRQERQKQLQPPLFPPDNDDADDGSE